MKYIHKDKKLTIKSIACILEIKIIKGGKLKLF